ncbi:MAG: Flp pilus assembly complex ATPase component TadA, partial [Candidatus Brocadiae bacterium]|nr:Flp pilus assembly complex ATPase component TadA [Candidatus Brocadiia bacterium]
LVTGPTGSGKTTTLYAALRGFDASERHILTLEDPIEYQLAGISQTQVNYKKGLTFVTGLRNVLRQDPDIIMVGEIRDLETARMAIQSALTGHLVFSTLHTNDSVSATTRLLDLGIEPYLISSSVIGVLAQRLVRRICPHCKAAAEVDGDLATRAGIGDLSASVWVGRGCDECLGTGYRGRTGIFELLLVDDPLRQQIMRRQQPSAMKASLAARGLRTLRMSGIGKVLRGVTTLEEVVRVTQQDEL